MPDRNKVSEEIQALEYMWLQSASRNFMTFVEGVQQPGVNGPDLFDEIMAPFQREFFEDIAPSLEALKEGGMPPRRRFWVERTKKASKDSDMALVVAWLIAFTERPLLIQVCAASSEQAGIIENRVRTLMHYNEWLEEHVEVVERKIRNKQRPNTVVCQIEATGSAGAAQGPTPDLLLLNELTHVDKWEVMATHMHNADGVPRGIVIVCTNAGNKNSPAWDWRTAAIENPKRWHTYILSEPAPWLNPEDIADAKSRDVIGTDFRRLWKGEWVSGAGSAVEEDVVEAAFRLDNWTYHYETGWLYLAGLDLGVSHDHAGLMIVGVDPKSQRVITARARRWAPTTVSGDKKEVDLINVERTAASWCKKYRVRSLHYDPNAGGSYMAQRLRKHGIICKEQSFKPAGMTAMAEAYVTLMKAFILECYTDDKTLLKQDLLKFNIEHKPPSNYKLVAMSDSAGHADVGTALLTCLPQAVEYLGGFGALLRTDTIASVDTEPLSREEEKNLPDEFKDLFKMYEEDDY